MGNGILFLTLKSEVPRPLKAELTTVALGEQTVFADRDRELHAVAALNLKGDEILTVSMYPGLHMTMMNLLALRHDQRGDAQTRRIVVIAPFSDPGDDDVNEYPGDQQKHEHEY